MTEVLDRPDPSVGSHSIVRKAGTMRGTAGAAARLRIQFPPRAVPGSWPETFLGRRDIVELLVPPPYGSDNQAVQWKRRSGITGVLRWLQGHSGATWQQRWLATGVQELDGKHWRKIAVQWLRSVGDDTNEPCLSTGLLALICGDVIRPGVRWMMTRHSPRFQAAMERSRDPDGFARLRACAQENPAAAPLMVRLALYRTATIMACKGGLIADIAPGDCVELLDIQSSVQAKGGTCKTYFYQLLHDAGIFPPDAPPTIRAFRGATGQLTVEALVDRFALRCWPVRNLLVEYLRYRQPAVDYVSLKELAERLAGLFWGDLERHHPGIHSLHLPTEVATAWKQRIQVRTMKTADTDGGFIDVETPRANAKSCMFAVRAFYLDIAQWALEDPARWGPWAAPCPVTPADVNRWKERMRHKARMDQRTRERLPHLPALVRIVEQRRHDTAERLAAARRTDFGETFTIADRTFLRPVMPTAGGTKVWADDQNSGVRHDLTFEEHEAFWAWATVEILRHTGIRAEELLELTHHSFIQYQLPATGELVPLLQIAPSKTDTERLLLISPELADVLSAVVCRVRDATGTVPLVPSYDIHECVWLPPMPLLFQRRWGAENRALPRRSIEKALSNALAHSGLTGPDQNPLDFTPHDFRRIFVTDAVMSGLPPHIAQAICGHRDINTTMGYKATYPEETIEAHRAWISRRRSVRPSEEYRTPTEQEWEDFFGHFQRRKVSLGTCGRAYNTPCIHEHACIRCPMLRPDPAQRPRLVEVHGNLQARISEAEQQGWLGEIEGLTISLAAAEAKLTDLDRLTNRQTTVHLGMPSVHHLVARTITTNAPENRSPE
ncbi:site-specific integrase [Parafrankia sp. FMc6]|uniref:tyrosine-type recombinase/integrase n=1 Tax=Parafrankia soli TaxID=2599596 RepID=UPI0034D5FECD